MVLACFGNAVPVMAFVLSALEPAQLFAFTLMVPLAKVLPNTTCTEVPLVEVPATKPMPVGKIQE